MALLDKGTFPWYKRDNGGGVKSLILRVLRAVPDNPFLGTIRCQALDFPERKLIDPLTGPSDREAAATTYRVAYLCEIPTSPPGTSERGLPQTYWQAGRRPGLACVRAVHGQSGVRNSCSDRSRSEAFLADRGRRCC